jgi:hypothetical protein
MSQKTMSDTESMREWVDVPTEEVERLRANNADLTKQNRQFAQHHTKIAIRNKELLAACPEHLLTIQKLQKDNTQLRALVAELEKINTALEERVRDDDATEELLAGAQELTFLCIEGRTQVDDALLQDQAPRTPGEDFQRLRQARAAAAGEAHLHV